mgnify:CR=1 FL=1
MELLIGIILGILWYWKDARHKCYADEDWDRIRKDIIDRLDK